jgi:repressor LexA
LIDMSETIGEKIKKIRLQRGLTIEQLAEKVGVSPSTISKYEKGKLGIDIDRLLEIAKALEVDPNVFFEGEEVSLTKLPKPVKVVPIYSLPVSAGNGRFPDEIYIIDYIAVHRLDVDFVIQVEGDSMEPIVPDGGYVLVRKTPEARDGNMVLCTYNGHEYVKWFHKRDGEIYLISENPIYPPIKVEKGDTFYIHGVVVDVIRGKEPTKRFKW